MNPDDETPSAPDDGPTAAPQGRNRHPGAAVPGTTGDPMVARLRSALDELTTGAEPSTTRLTPLSSGRRRWMLPAVAAAAVALVAGVAVAVVGRDDGGTPAAPAPMGPAVTPAPMIPWYALDVEEAGHWSAPTLNFGGGDGLVARGSWASGDYSRILLVTLLDAQGNGLQAIPGDQPIIDPPLGTAWISASGPNDTWRNIRWMPDDASYGFVAGYGFTSDELIEVFRTLQVQAGAEGVSVVSTLSSLIPMPNGDADGGVYYSGATLDSPPGPPPYRSVGLAVSTGGFHALLMSRLTARQTVRPVTTPFGEGIRVDDPEGLPPAIWWPVDGGPYWAGLSAPADQVEAWLQEIRRVADIPMPSRDATTSTLVTPPDTSDGKLPVDTSVPPPSVADVPSTISVTGPVTTPPHSSAATATATTTPPASTSPEPPIPTNVSEPAMTAVAPASFPGERWKPPIAVGESVMLSAAQAIGERGIELHATEAVQASGIAEQLESLRDADRLGDVVIVQVGTNGTVTPGDLERIMAAADVERVVVLTVHADRLWIAPNNELIRALPDRYPNVVVVDWDQIAATCGCLTADGIHVEDRDVYADAIATAAGLT